MEREIGNFNEERNEKARKEMIATEFNKDLRPRSKTINLRPQIYLQLPINQPKKEKATNEEFFSIQIPQEDTVITIKKGQRSSLPNKEFSDTHSSLNNSRNQLLSSNSITSANSAFERSYTKDTFSRKEANSSDKSNSGLNPFIKTLNDRSSEVEGKNPISIVATSGQTVNIKGGKTINKRKPQGATPNTYDVVLGRLRSSYLTTEDISPKKTVESENREELIQESSLVISQAPALLPKKYTYIPPKDISTNDENGKKLELYLEEQSRMQMGVEESDAHHISDLIDDSSVEEFGVLFDNSVDQIKNNRASVYTIDLPLDYTGDMKKKGLRQKTLLGAKSEKSTNIPDSLPSKVPKAVANIFEGVNSKSVNQRKKSTESLRGSNGILLPLPVGPREYLDPAVIFAEKQMDAWEKMKKEVNQKQSTTYNHKFKKFAEIIEVIKALRELGMSPNLLNRVAKSTLSVVLKIKIWRKRVQDNKASRNEPIRKFTGAFDKEMAKKVPMAIKIDIKIIALSILRDFEKKYRDTLGTGHLRTINASNYFKALKETVPFAIDIELEEYQKSSILFLKNKKIYPVDIEGTREMDSVPAISKAPNALKSPSLPPIVRTATVGTPCDEVLVNIDEEE